MQPARPWIRAMPSPSSTAVPTSADSACPSNSLIWALMMSVISEAVDGICFTPSITRELRAQRVELRPHRCIHQVITELDLRTTNERIVDGEGRFDRVTAALLEPSEERSLRRRVEGHRSCDRRLDDAGTTIDEVPESARA